MTTRTTALAALAATMTLALTAAPAAVAARPLPELHTGTFKVELKGVQETNWTSDWSTTEGCDLSASGSGSETVVFRAKPATIKASWIGDTRVFTRGRGAATRTAFLDLVATITRDGRQVFDGETCSDGDGGAQPVAPDCGTKRSRLTVELDYAKRRSDLITISPDFNVPLGPFRSCPTGGISFPDILNTHPGTARVVGADLPVADLFKYGKNIVIADDRAVQDTGGDKSTTTIRWTLSFTRLEGRRDGSAQRSA